MNTAQLLKDNLPGYNGHAALYRVNPPLKGWDGDDSYSLVVLSTAEGLDGHETYIFPADENGQVTDWLELQGSQRDVTSHQQVLEDAGYVVVNEHSEIIR